MLLRFLKESFLSFSEESLGPVTDYETSISVCFDFVSNPVYHLIFPN